jgi:hypothetical protein
VMVWLVRVGVVVGADQGCAWAAEVLVGREVLQGVMLEHAAEAWPPARMSPLATTAQQLPSAHLLVASLQLLTNSC